MPKRISLRIPVILEKRVAMISASGGASSASWEPWEGGIVRGGFSAEDDDQDSLADEGRQAQERRDSILVVRFHPKLASALNGTWRARFKIHRDMKEEIHEVRNLGLMPKGERPRYIHLLLMREVK